MTQLLVCRKISNLLTYDFAMLCLAGEPVRELDIAHIPNDAKIDLPENVFGATGVETFQDLQKAGAY